MDIWIASDLQKKSVTLIERDVFFEVDENDTMETFMNIRSGRPYK